MYNRILELIVLGLWIFIAIIVYVQKELSSTGALTISQSLALSEEELNIKKISILSNNLFEITLDEDEGFSKPVVGSIECDGFRCAESDILNLFKKVTNPKVILVQKQKNNVWLIKINFILENKKMSLMNWLISNNLVHK